jgi:VWFA-related protein
MALLVVAMALPGTPAGSGVLVLGDGSALRMVGEPRREAPLVFIELEGGTYASLRDDQVDWAATERARQMLAETEPSPPGRSGRGRGPVEFEALPEAVRLGALVHTAPRLLERLPWIDRADGAAPPVGPPRPGRRQEPLAVRRAGAARAEDELRSLTPLIGPPPPAPRSVLALLADRVAGRRARFVEPRPGEAVVGTTTLQVTPARAETEVESVEFRVDGQPAGRATTPPWRVTWQFRPEPGLHQLEAHIHRADGMVERAEASVYSVRPDAEVEVELVPLTVTVTNQQMFFVRTLAAEDFRVYEDGVPQEIAHFSRDVVPLSILVAIDASWSMNGRRLAMAKEGVRRLVEAAGYEDRIGLGTFNESLRLLLAPTQDRLRALDALNAVAADGGTAMFDAELEAIRLLAGEGGRRLLVVLGDGEDYLSEADVEQVTRAAQQANVTVYSVGMLAWRLEDGVPEHWAESIVGSGKPRHWAEKLRVRGLKFLREQAENTGGVLYMPRFTGELPYVFEHLLAELKNAYALGYYPKNHARDGRFRAISVEVDGVGLTARTRSGYYAREAAAAAQR